MALPVTPFSLILVAAATLVAASQPASTVTPAVGTGSAVGVGSKVAEATRVSVGCGVGVAVKGWPHGQHTAVPPGQGSVPVAGATVPGPHGGGG